MTVTQISSLLTHLREYGFYLRGGNHAGLTKDCAEEIGSFLISGPKKLSRVQIAAIRKKARFLNVELSRLDAVVRSKKFTAAWKDAIVGAPFFERGYTFNNGIHFKSIQIEVDHAPNFTGIIGLTVEPPPRLERVSLSQMVAHTSEVEQSLKLLGKLKDGGSLALAYIYAKARFVKRSSKNQSEVSLGNPMDVCRLLAHAIEFARDELRISDTVYTPKKSAIDPSDIRRTLKRRSGDPATLAWARICFPHLLPELAKLKK